MAIFTLTASDGMPIEMTDHTLDTNMKLAKAAPTHKRDMARAGKTVTVDIWECTYDANGYLVRVKNIGGKSIMPRNNFAFVNDAVGDEKVGDTGLYYKNCTAASDDGVVFAVHDGGQNYVCMVDVVTHEIVPNVGNPKDADLVKRMTSYGTAFLKAYLGK